MTRAPSPAPPLTPVASSPRGPRAAAAGATSPHPPLQSPLSPPFDGGTAPSGAPMALLAHRPLQCSRHPHELPAAVDDGEQSVGHSVTRAHGVSVDGEAFRLEVEMRGTVWWAISCSSSWPAPGQKETRGCSEDAISSEKGTKRGSPYYTMWERAAVRTADKETPSPFFSLAGRRSILQVLFCCGPSVPYLSIYRTTFLFLLPFFFCPAQDRRFFLSCLRSLMRSLFRLLSVLNALGHSR